MPEAAHGVALVAFADVDWRTGRRTFDENPNVPKYQDFRKMLDKHHKEIDACTVTTPDHMHTYIAATCMAMGKHVYVQKPLTYSIYEARMLTEAAKKYKTVGPGSTLPGRSRTESGPISGRSPPPSLPAKRQKNRS